MWSENALKVWNRYLSPGETPERRLRTVAEEIAKAEALFGGDQAQVDRYAELFYNLMAEKKFLPNSPTLRNVGRDENLSRSACFVIPIEDSMESIFTALKSAALIQKAGGGVGANFSSLRPRGDLIASTGGTSSGPVGFMRVFDAAAEEIKQGGVRRGAWIFILDADHPDIGEFIKADFKNANISVLVKDDFMRKSSNQDDSADFAHVNPRDQKSMAVVDARAQFREICERAWQTGNPGFLFYDRINADNPLPGLGPITACNPCGELPMHPDQACNLGSLNLSMYWDEKRGLLIDDLRRDAAIATRFLNDVIEVSHYPTPEIDHAVRRTMLIGLGVMGAADLLLAAGLPYYADEARDMIRSCMAAITGAAVEESRLLASEREVFPLWESSVWGQNGDRVRNAAMTTVAPTGTLSTLFDSSGGIEPIFAVTYTRTTNEGNVLTYLHPGFIETARREGFYSEKMLEQVREQGSVLGIADIPVRWQEVFRGAHEIDWQDHIKMQAAVQSEVHNAVSKTINLPYEASVEDVAGAYTMAWQLGCKGVTVFRDGCRGEQVLKIKSSKADPQGFYLEGRKLEGEWGRLLPLKLPLDLPARRFYVETPVGELQLTVATDNAGRPLEIFGQVGHAGSDINADVEAVCRLTSVTLRSGVALWYVIKQLMGIGGRSSVGFGAQKVRSLPDAIGQVLNKHFLAGEDSPVQAGRGGQVDLCPECGSANFVHESGCAHCQVCGYSSC